MTISLSCTCGKNYSVDASLAGKRVKCKACGASLTVPGSPTADQPAAVQNRPAPTKASTAPAARVAPAFFLAHLNSALGGSQLFRAYVDADALNLVHVGPFTALTDPELARRLDSSHWAVKTADTIKTWMLAAAGGAVVAVGVLGVALSRAAFREPSKALELVSFMLTAGGLLVPIAVVFVGGSIWRIMRRVRQLESMTPEQLREEATKAKSGLRVTAHDVSEVQLQSLSPEGGGLGAKPVARLSFKHQPSGAWKLNLYTLDDAKLAAAAMRRLAGAGKATIDPSFG